MSLFGRRLGYEYSLCASCGTIQLDPMPDEVSLKKAYISEYANAGHYEGNPEVCRRVSRTYYRSILRTLWDYGVQGPVLDYGSGWGGLTDLLIRNSIKCEGVEISRDVVTYCKEKGLPVEHGDITTLEGMRFATLVLCTVFEHLIEHEAFLTRANQLLQEGGLLVTLQPTALFANFMGRVLRLGSLDAPLPEMHQAFCPPWHTAFFSFEGMRRLMSRHGFKLIEIRPAPQGRVGGVMTILQLSVETVNRVG
jgi:SAM-dependent methyltransferase